MAEGDTNPFDSMEYFNEDEKEYTELGDLVTSNEDEAKPFNTYEPDLSKDISSTPKKPNSYKKTKQKIRLKYFIIGAIMLGGLIIIVGILLKFLLDGKDDDGTTHPCSSGVDSEGCTPSVLFDYCNDPAASAGLMESCCIFCDSLDKPMISSDDSCKYSAMCTTIYRTYVDYNVYVCPNRDDEKFKVCAGNNPCLGNIKNCSHEDRIEYCRRSSPRPSECQEWCSYITTDVNPPGAGDDNCDYEPICTEINDIYSEYFENCGIPDKPSDCENGWGKGLCTSSDFNGYCHYNGSIREVRDECCDYCKSIQPVGADTKNCGYANYCTTCTGQDSWSKICLSPCEGNIFDNAVCLPSERYKYCVDGNTVPEECHEYCDEINIQDSTANPDNTYCEDEAMCVEINPKNYDKFDFCYPYGCRYESSNDQHGPLKNTECSSDNRKRFCSEIPTDAAGECFNVQNSEEYDACCNYCVSPINNTVTICTDYQTCLDFGFSEEDLHKANSLYRTCEICEEGNLENCTADSFDAHCVPQTPDSANWHECIDACFQFDAQSDFPRFCTQLDDHRYRNPCFNGIGSSACNKDKNYEFYCSCDISGQPIDECKNPTRTSCTEECFSLSGGYLCSSDYCKFHDSDNYGNYCGTCSTDFFGHTCQSEIFWRPFCFEGEYSEENPNPICIEECTQVDADITCNHNACLLIESSTCGMCITPHLIINSNCEDPVAFCAYNANECRNQCQTNPQVGCPSEGNADQIIINICKEYLTPTSCQIPDCSNNILNCIPIYSDTRIFDNFVMFVNLATHIDLTIGYKNQYLPNYPPAAQLMRSDASLNLDTNGDSNLWLIRFKGENNPGDIPWIPNTDGYYTKTIFLQSSSSPSHYLSFDFSDYDPTDIINIPDPKLDFYSYQWNNNIINDPKFIFELAVINKTGSPNNTYGIRKRVTYKNEDLWLYLTVESNKLVFREFVSYYESNYIWAINNPLDDTNTFKTLKRQNFPTYGEWAEQVGRDIIPEVGYFGRLTLTECADISIVTSTKNIYTEKYNFNGDCITSNDGAEQSCWRPTYIDVEMGEYFNVMVGAFMTYFNTTSPINSGGRFMKATNTSVIQDTIIDKLNVDTSTITNSLTSIKLSSVNSSTKNQFMLFGNTVTRNDLLMGFKVSDIVDCDVPARISLYWNEYNGKLYPDYIFSNPPQGFNINNIMFQFDQGVYYDEGHDGVINGAYCPCNVRFQTAVVNGKCFKIQNNYLNTEGNLISYMKSLDTNNSDVGWTDEEDATIWCFNTYESYLNSYYRITYHVKPAGTNLCLNFSKGNPAKVITCVDSVNVKQTIDLIQIGTNGNNGIYNIRNYNSGQNCLYYSTGNPTTVRASSNCTDGINGEFTFYEI